MKAFNKTIWNLALIMAIVICDTSCKKNFLEEDLTTQRSLDYYKTDQGIKDLVVGAYYQVLCSPFGGEWIYCNTNYGTDEFHVGGDASNAMYNNYDSRLGPIVTNINSNTAAASDQWDNLYEGIGDANLIIQNVDESSSTNTDVKETALGAGYFFRAYNYLRLVSQYGAVPLKLKPSSTVELEFTRDSARMIYAQIISDLTKAYKLLPDKPATPGRLDKDAAAHYLAKAYLFRASEINDSWNGSTKTKDLDSVITLANIVIPHHSLANNFSDLWDYTRPDGPNENLSEIILSAQFSADISTKGENHQHLYFISKYDDLPFMKRDLTGDRPYSRLSPTYYMFDIYDLKDDSRFWKSFKTEDRVNNASGGYYVNGDLGVMYVINQPGDNRFAGRELKNSVIYAKTGKTIPSVFVAYPKGVTKPGAFYADYGRFPSLNKYIDASRVSINDGRGLRDVILARSAETYLMAAEAEIRLKQYNEALNYINAVRQRAAWKSGEDRSAYVDGGAAYPSSPLNQDPNLNSYMPENSYYVSNNLPATTTAATSLTVTDIHHLPVADEAVIRKLGYTSDYDRMMCFLLDEKSRELSGEFHRWADLSRTKTLVARVRAFNPDAAGNIQSYHDLRPIPQTYLDGIQKDGHALTPEQKQAQQNPGY
jgi:hypothetical protein